MAGGRPFRIRPHRPQLDRRPDALVLGGGADIDPQAYSEEQVLKAYLQDPPVSEQAPWYRKVAQWLQGLIYPLVFLLRKWFSRSSPALDKDRDRLELYLLGQAAQAHLPVLGICRGAQLINVYHGGTLHQDIGSFYYEEPNPRSIFPVKEIWVQPESQLAEVLGVHELAVNALHHQAVKDEGQALEVVAREKNTVAQGIEKQGDSKQFVLGVQWHPEFLPHLPRQRALFEALVDAARTT